MYANPHYLVETGWLADHLDHPELRIFDVTGMLTSKFVNLAEERSYNEGHIPGAVFLDIAGRDQALATPEASLPWTWPSTTLAAETLGRIGISNNSRVILYAASPRPGVDKGVMWATRCWWLMHSFGVDCAILNGGFEKWVAEERPVSKEMSQYPATTYQIEAEALGRVATKVDVLSALNDQDTCIVDALPPESYAGEREVGYGEGKGKGHITGAVNVPMDSLLDDSGVFLEAEAMREQLEAAGLLGSPRVITYCGGGIAATVDAFALELLGHEGVAVYDGSLSEWVADPNAPMMDPSL